MDNIIIFKSKKSVKEIMDSIRFLQPWDVHITTKIESPVASDDVRKAIEAIEPTPQGDK